jgi:hypothetical protein
MEIAEVDDRELGEKGMETFPCNIELAHLKAPRFQRSKKTEQHLSGLGLSI